MSEFPLAPQMSSALSSAALNKFFSITAMLSVPNCFLRLWEVQKAADEANAHFAHVDGDNLM